MFLQALGHHPDSSERSAQSLDVAQIMQSASDGLLPFSEVFKVDT